MNTMKYFLNYVGGKLSVSDSPEPLAQVCFVDYLSNAMKTQSPEILSAAFDAHRLSDDDIENARVFLGMPDAKIDYVCYDESGDVIEAYTGDVFEAYTGDDYFDSVSKKQLLGHVDPVITTAIALVQKEAGERMDAMQKNINLLEECRIALDDDVGAFEIDTNERLSRIEATLREIKDDLLLLQQKSPNYEALKIDKN